MNREGLRKRASSLLNRYPILPQEGTLLLLYLYNTLNVRLASLHDQAYSAYFSYLPPAGLRDRVSGTADAHEFMLVGRKIADDLTNILGRLNRSWPDFEKVLDFGCGCCRVMTHLRQWKNKLYGTDIDKKAITWCGRSIDFASFSVNKPAPPLEFPSEFFDLIYSISVFTHLDERYQFDWLNELRRVTRPHALLLLSIHGNYAARINKLNPCEKQKLKQEGFLYLTHYGPGPFPKFYGST
jgi:SAM-dependent methyltransferase